MRNLEQERAAFALAKIDAVKQDVSVAAKVAMHLRRLPAMILTNGLGQALAFLLADAGSNESKPSYIVYDMLAEWLVTKRRFYQGNRADLLRSLANGDRAKYQQAQEETWALLNWLKKCADAYLPAAEPGEGGAS